MKKNVGNLDKMVRVILGIAILAIGYYFKSWWGVLGLIPLATAATARCGLYVPFNIDTTEKNKNGAL
ncbi:MAG: DUF2892 domain-containing protein [Candidatus Marinimicrobia bacterium]|nr:DUF2892 domain-containing protein [Candidatus Neomarinimicrobiota bacterium]